MAKDYYILPKRQIFAKSGHTGEHETYLGYLVNHRQAEAKQS